MWLLKWLPGLFLAVLPSWLKIPLYRLFLGYRIGKGVRIGFTPFIGVRRCTIGDHVRIGSLNLFLAIEQLEIGAYTQIGYLNIFRGGRSVCLGSYVTVLRQNVFNAIIDGDFLQPVSSTIELGVGVVITTGHWLDFSERITIGSGSMIGGRNSSLWTHNRQRSRGIEIGAHCYLGSEVRLAPGVEIPPLCIIAIGSVLVGRYLDPRSLIGGNPATVIRPLRESDYFLVCHKTRTDIPDEVAFADLPADLLPNALAPAKSDPTSTERVAHFEPGQSPSTPS